MTDLLFGHRLRLILGSRPKRDVALAMGIRPHQLSRYLRGQVPDAAILIKLSAELGVSMDWLLTGRVFEKQRQDRYGRPEEDAEPNVIGDNWDSIPKPFQQTLLGCYRILLEGKKVHRSHLIAEIKMREGWMRLQNSEE
ncbi:MAG: helix-turn-helix domain-containing protein [Nitrospiraceae bacterium]|nr:helix-turn-helix domain-containing protein [Nitrospiraceae bacterium]